MKINVRTADEQIITLDVDPEEAVENVKALLHVQQQELLYNDKVMSNHDKLSELGVQDGDLVTVLSNSRSSPNVLGLNPDGSAVNSVANQHDVRRAHISQSITDCGENALEAGRENPLSFLPEMDNPSQLLDKESYSKLESVGGNYDVCEEVKIQRNGTCSHVDDDDHDRHHDLKSSDQELSSESIQKLDSGTEVGNPQLLYSYLPPTTSSPPVPINSPPAPTKGYGLKKWRRIRREVTNDSSSNPDATKMLKRGSANISDVKQPNDESVSFTNAFFDSPRHDGHVPLPSQSSNCGLAVDTTFSAGADNSEDRSSKSSTAASAPKYRNDAPRVSGHHQREKHRTKNVSGRHLNSSGQRFQLGKSQAQADSSKKARGESVFLEKENSFSSMESDSRSCSSVFMRGTSSVNSAQMQGERLINYDGEDAYDQPAGEVQSAEESQAGHSQNADLSPDCSAEYSCSANKGKSKDHQLSSNCEPLVNSILMLQSAQEALEREVKMFKEIGKGFSSLCDDSGNTTGAPVHSVFVGSEICADRGSDGLDLEFNHAYLSKNAQKIEKQLEEAKVRLDEKELRVVELETVIKGMDLPQDDVRRTMRIMELQHKKFQEMEAELEDLFKQKVEAEVQYVVITRSTKDLSVLVEDQIKLLREQKSLARKQEESLRRMADVGNKAVMLQGQAEKLDTLYTVMAEGEQIKKMHSRVVKLASCLFIQLMLLALVFGLCVWELFPKSTTVVPT